VQQSVELARFPKSLERQELSVKSRGRDTIGLTIARQEVAQAADLPLRISGGCQRPIVSKGDAMNALDRSSCPPPRDASQHCAPEILAIVEPLPETSVAALSQRLEKELADLEDRFREFVTNSSLIRDLRRR
jgi:hypothetical protein